MATTPLSYAAAIALALPAMAVAVPATAAPDSAGWDGQRLHWTTQTVAPGVSLRTGTLDEPDVAPYWTVTIGAPATNDLTGKPTVAELGSPQWASDTAHRLNAAGYPARQDTINWPDFSDTPHGVEGVRVRTGSYPDQAQAQATAADLRSHGFPTAAAEWTGFDADQAPDHERVHVAVIDPKQFRGDVQATHDGNVAQREKTTAVAAKLGAAVAVNGGFFVTSDADGVQGVPSGLAAYQGQLQSQSAGNRAALLLGHGTAPRIENLRSTMTVHSGSESHPVEGINRKPGILRDCGRPNAQPTTQPRQDVTCTTDDELVVFTSEFGADLPTGAGLQVTLDHSGKVTAIGSRGGRVAAGESVVQGIGASADWLRDHAVPGTHLSLDKQIRNASNDPVTLHDGAGLVSAAPMLLHGGQMAIDAATEGVVDPRDLSFGYAWAEQRQPRTMAGIDAQGRLLLVTVDGRQPSASDGVTVAEGARLMRSLGAVDALNLDGGGSTTMAVNGALANHPSDTTGERAVGDTVTAVPRR